MPNQRSSQPGRDDKSREQERLDEQRRARERNRDDSIDDVEEASRESFPASDPPSTGTTRVGPRRESER